MVSGNVVSVEPLEWDQFVGGHSQAHVLQSSAWGRLKSQFGWSDERMGLIWQNNLVAGAQVLYRRLPGGLGRLAYVPKGPLVDWTAKEQVTALVGGLDRAARAREAVALTIEPDLPDEPRWSDSLRELGFAPSMFASIQPRSTLIVDISPTEEAILGAMKSKTRYNVRLAARKGVTVREAEEADLPAFHSLMTATAARDSFGVHTPAYYEVAYRLFVPKGWARLFLAEVADHPVAALMVFAFPPRSWYFYGASGDDHREKMPTYLLQWEAIRWAKSVGCTTYDLWGIPDEDMEMLEAGFAHRRDGLWGVYRFKRGFGGELVRSVGAWDRAYAQLRYRLYRWMLELVDHVRGGSRSELAGQG
jgi:lipid II:glycine glycyltransferase (peptidoglycan interpeptide bridge formation enzyme)